MAERLLTVRDVSLILGISEKEVTDLVENKRLEAYKVGGVYLRFKEEQITAFRKSVKPASKHKTITSHQSNQYKLKDRISDFFYFNDFYLLSILIILLILVIIFQWH